MADAFERGTRPVFQLLSLEQARRLAAYHADDSLKQRVEELATKCNEVELSPSEQAEYEGYVRANKFIAVLQAEARKCLSLYAS